MLLQRATDRQTVLDGLDPRVRVGSAGVLSLLPILLERRDSLAVLLVLALGLCLAEFIPAGYLIRRIAAVNTFMLMVVLILPWSVAGEALFTVGNLQYSEQGLSQAILILLKCNSVMLTFTAFISTMEPVVLGHALDKLRLPSKLTHLFLFTLRYLTVLEDEYRQLRQAMSLRQFQSGLNIHTLKTFGNLVGMLLVRALDRSERIMDAMICRGYSGKFYAMRHYVIRSVDYGALLLVVVVTVAMLGWNYA
jgi:cobalt/nickel transport system permease protein